MMSASNLPPSTEEAYRKKCIALRRRMQDVEENNDAVRLRRVRLVRGIRKMRIERAILLDALSKRMRKNGAAGTIFDEDSEDSTESPPTVGLSLATTTSAHVEKPQERPLRVKKPHRRLPDVSSPPPDSTAQPPAGGQLQMLPHPATKNELDVSISFAGETGHYSRRDLVPTSETLLSSTPASVTELLKEHFIRLLPKYGHASLVVGQEAVAVQEFFDGLPDDIKQEWLHAEQIIRSNVDKVKAHEEWKKTVGSSRSKSVGNKPIDLDDDDVVMIEAQDTKS